MYIVALVLLHTPMALDVAVEPLSGSKQTGALVELDSRHIAIEVDGKQQSYDMRDLLTVVMQHGEESTVATAPKVWIDLIDGSRILATEYLVKNRTAEIQWTDRSVTIETRNVRSVRFQPPSEGLDAQWQEMLAGKGTGDVLVLRRSRTSLDQLTGVFQDVTADVVDFEYDDQQIPVKRTKLEGIIYHQGVVRELPPAVCTVQEANGTAWRVKSIEWQEGHLRLVTVGGAQCAVPWAALRRLDFSAGNVVYLSDLPFDLTQCTPYIASLVSPKRMMQLNAPRRDNGFEGSGLWLAAGSEIQQYDRGLAIHSRSELVYRLAEPFRTLTAVVGIDSRLQGRGNLVLVIFGDDRELFRRSIAGTDPPFPLDLNIEGVRRLRILVDFGETLDVADHLNLCNARIIK